MQPHWVGDLTLESTVDIKSASDAKVNPGGSVRWELVKAGIPHRCTIDLATGVATFTRGDEEIGHGDTPIKGPGRHRVEFANVDERMTLVDRRASGRRGWLCLRYRRGQSGPDGRGPRAGGSGRAQCVGRGERPCPETRYLLYPVPGPVRL